MAGLIAMSSVFVVVGIEMFFAMRGAGHVHSSDFDKYGAVNIEEEGENESTYHDEERHINRANVRHGSMKRSHGPPPTMLGDIHASTEYLMAGRSPSVGQSLPLPPSSHTQLRKSTDSADEDLDLDLDELNTNAGLLNGKTKALDEDDSSDHALNTANNNPSSHKYTHTHDPTAAQVAHQKALLQCLLLEAGILFHSIFIGMALSVTVGPPFAVLLVAISFHQTFEGLALGSRISALQFPAGSIKPWLMALAYGTTTPIGQAIGLAIHKLYDPASETGLLTVGMMNAVSSGLLLFAGLVELLAEDFLSEESYRTLRGRRRGQACGSVIAGALLMALVGAWA
jgi:hypothetical protein